MRGDVLLAEALRQMARDPLDQRRVLTNTSVVRCSRTSVASRSYTASQTSPDITASSGAGGISSLIAGANVAAVDDGAARPLSRARGADEKARDLLDRLLRCRQSDARQRAGRERLQSLDRERQVGAALVAGNRVNFIDDDGTAGREHVRGRSSSRAVCTATQEW